MPGGEASGVGLGVIDGDLCCVRCGARVQLHGCECGAWSLVCRWCGQTWAPRRCPECASVLIMCLGVERFTGAIGPRKLFLLCSRERCTWKGPEAVVDVKVLVCDHAHGEAVH